jgi:phosphomannomutase
MTRLRETPPDRIGGYDVTVTDLRPDDGTDAVILAGGEDDISVRMVVRPSGTEPKVKSYIEVRCSDVTDLAAARQRARRLQDEVADLAARF